MVKMPDGHFFFGNKKKMAALFLANKKKDGRPFFGQ